MKQRKPLTDEARERRRLRKKTYQNIKKSWDSHIKKLQEYQIYKWKKDRGMINT